MQTGQASILNQKEIKLLHVISAFLVFCIIVVAILLRKVIKNSLLVQVEKVETLETEITAELEKEKAKNADSTK